MTEQQSELQNEAQEERKYPLATSAKFAGGAALATLPLDLLCHLGPSSILVGGIASLIAWRHGPEIVDQLKEWFPELFKEGMELPKLGRIFSDQGEVPDEGDEPDQDAKDDDPRFAVQRVSDTNGVQRLTIKQIVRHTEPNSYKIWIGSSLTQKGNPAVLVNFYKQHIRFMGASQRGKSSMVAAFLEIITKTHDKKHVLLVILDKEDQTGRLFAHLPHIAKLQIGGDMVKLHARNDEQVLEYLTYVVAIMNKRYTLSKLELLEQPILLVYIEEFLSLKNYFKDRMNRAKSAEAKEKATADYRTLVYCIEEISQRGLKARVQLLLCAQVEYADDDFREALVNVACGFSFCVRPTAAAAAGFRNKDLIRRNAQENKIGQAVVETPDCNDLILAPEYDLEARLIALEKAEVLHTASRPATSETGSVSPSVATSNTHPALYLVEGARNGSRRETKGPEVARPLRELSELEKRIGELFFGQKKMNPTAIVREIYPDVKGGDAYQKASAEVAEAIRACVEVQRGGA